MIIQGTHVLQGARRGRVYEALVDPALLARAMPGCKQLVDEGDGVFGLTIEAGAGSVRGAYSGQVRLGEREAPSSYEATLDASGTAGSVQAHLSARLEEIPDGTQVDYYMDAKVAGAIAGVGQRVLSGVSRKNARMFFDALEQELAAAPAANGAPAAAEPRVHAGGRSTSGETPNELRWFVRGLLAGFLLAVASSRLGQRRGQR